MRSWPLWKKAITFGVFLGLVHFVIGAAFIKFLGQYAIMAIAYLEFPVLFFFRMFNYDDFIQVPEFEIVVLGSVFYFILGIIIGVGVVYFKRINKNPQT